MVSERKRGGQQKREREIYKKIRFGKFSVIGAPKKMRTKQKEIFFFCFGANKLYNYTIGRILFLTRSWFTKAFFVNTMIIIYIIWPSWVFFDKNQKITKLHFNKILQHQIYRFIVFANSRFSRPLITVLLRTSHYFTELTICSMNFLLNKKKKPYTCLSEEKNKKIVTIVYSR